MFSRLNLLFRFVAPGPSPDHNPPSGLLSRLEKLDLPRAAKPIAGKARQYRRHKGSKKSEGMPRDDGHPRPPASRADSAMGDTASAASVSFHSANQERTPASDERPCVSTVSSATDASGASIPTTDATDAPIALSEDEPLLAPGDDVDAALMFMNSQRFSLATVRETATIESEPVSAVRASADKAPQGQAPDAALILRPEGQAAVAILAALDAQKASASTYEPIASAIRPLAQLPPLETALRLQALAS